MEAKEKNLIARYPFDDTSEVGKDISGNANTAIPKGRRKPKVMEVCGKKAAFFDGGEYGSSYMQLPPDILKDVSDDTGFTVSAWVCGSNALNVWERIFDFGKGHTGPYVFLTRFMRGVCFAGSDILTDAGLSCPVDEWIHIAFTATGTKGGFLSSAGSRVYVNGELAADGFISQTSSGNYKRLREWFATFDNPDNYCNNYIGHSQFDADVDFCGAISDFRIYNNALSEEDIISLMCESMSDEQILRLAKNKFLPTPAKIISDDLHLPLTLVDRRVNVKWSCDKPELIDDFGKVTPSDKPDSVKIKATLECDGKHMDKTFNATVLPKSIPPYEITVHGDNKVLSISDTLYGLFYEDINNSADGGLYAEMINNRSFEEFTYSVYDVHSGEDGKSGGRIHNPLRFWFGDIDKVTVKNTGGLNEYFGLNDPEANAYYIQVKDGTTLYNRGFCDSNHEYSMNIKEGASYHFSIWAKPEENASIKIKLLDGDGNTISDEKTINLTETWVWSKYQDITLTATQTTLGQIELTFIGNTAIDMVSLMPDDVWGANEEDTSKTAHSNFLGNSNYRLRRDLVEAMLEMYPTFLRFPGGCISEGSYIWDNVYDWKDSVGDVAIRKENYNVWGYTMTLGLGYMEYFQLAEDLNAEPLPVMACGVLCQARSDYANPAGGKLQEKYINNFTDLIDFAISTDFENNKWAALRKEMGHEAPFGLHYLGVGNENWGPEFFASFQEFKHAIDEHMKKNYPDYELHIISTVGAQADDEAYQQGWRFLGGFKKGGATIRFTDGEKSFDKDVTWYPYEKNYLDTIADEHYYRANDYLLENVDRYNYYYRPCENGELIENQVSKVFVGEYASSDKNTLAGAVAEAATMTGFERNSDVVRLAATAPLFNKVVADGTYRWTPDAIWFDNETVWKTPNYYVQQMFAKYIGTDLLKTSYATYEKGKRTTLEPRGGVTLSFASGKATFKSLKITDNKTGKILLEQDFSKPLSNKLLPLKKDGKEGYYICEPDWKNYTVDAVVEKNTVDAALFVGVGLHGVDDTSFSTDNLNLLEYCVGFGFHGTGLKVYKDGKEGYTMGDYSSSIFTGNLRACYGEPVPAGKEYTITVNYGGEKGENIICYYTDDSSEKMGLLDYKLEAYNRDVFHSVTSDDKKVYMKMVNADYFDKTVKINLDNLPVSETATLVTLTHEPELVHIPNVNTKEKELIVPETKEITVSESFDIKLNANSVNVLVFEKKA